MGTISTDPIGFSAGDANLYRYAGNAVTGAIDPSGLDHIVKDSDNVIWRSSRPTTYFGGEVGEEVWETNLGRDIGNGWVELNAGGRATFSSLQHAANSITGASRMTVSNVVDAVRSPFRIVQQADQLGIFIGGTNQHMNGLGNVERMYNSYAGTKFYYGGIGNVVDSLDQTFDGATGAGWDVILERAVADIDASLNPGQEIHIFGWSRGAAIGNGLAARLARKGIRVSFVGMFDPVYSKSFPGQMSLGASSTSAGVQGNFVEASISGNVDAAAVIYAINERRSFFPAVKFSVRDGTNLQTLVSPGFHGEIGGHFLSNMSIQQLNMKAMIEFARGHGGARFEFRGIHSDIQRMLDSPASPALLSLSQNELERWRAAGQDQHWSPLSSNQYFDFLEYPNIIAWEIGGVGAQKKAGMQTTVGVLANTTRAILLPMSYASHPMTPMSDHYPRDLSWGKHRELWDFPLTNNSGQRIRISNHAQQFIRSLYTKEVDVAKGGWAK